MKNGILRGIAAGLLLSAAFSPVALAEDVARDVSSTTSLPVRLKPPRPGLPAADASAAVAQPRNPALKAHVSGSANMVTPQAWDEFGIPYTTTRVQLGATSANKPSLANMLSTTYPYRTVGLLNFDQGYCTASLIARSVLVTAAHCVQDFGTGAARFTNFTFVPGYYGATGATQAQIAPYGTWALEKVVVPATWSNGTDPGADAARENDVAVFIVARGGKNVFIGDVVGRMAYGANGYSFVSSSKTGNLETAAVTTLGYPYDMDRGAIMQRTDGPAYETVVSGAKQLWQGSNFTSGSSGGPWVVNFSGVSASLSGGASEGRQARMSVVGVTSWGSDDPNDPKDNYSSQFAQNSTYPNANYGVYGPGNIGSLMNTLCRTAKGNSTYGEQGYCNP